MVKGRCEAATPVSMDALAQDAPVFVVSVNITDHGIEDEVFCQFYPALLRKETPFKNVHAGKNAMDGVRLLLESPLGLIMDIPAGQNLVAMI